VSAFFVSHAKAGNNTASYTPVGSNGFKISYASNGTPVITSTPTTVTSGATTGETLIRDMFKVPGPAGKTIDVSAARKIPWGTVARTAARAAPYVAAGWLIYDIYQSFRVKPDGSGGWQHDPGKPEEDVPSYTSGGYYGFTPIGACQNFADSQSRSWTSDGYRYVLKITMSSADGVRTCYGNSVQQTYRYPSGEDLGSVSVPVQYDYQTAVQRMCKPPSVKGRDGKCSTDAYEPITQTQAEDLWRQHAPPEEATKTVEEMLERDVQWDPKPATEVTGPAKVQGEPRVKTETDAEGNTKTTTQRDVYNITYQGDSYTWNVTTITENSDGTKTEETDPEPEKVAPAADPEMPGLPDLYERKYPDGIQGVWNEHSSGLQQTPIFQFLGALAPGVADGGCPVWRLDAGEVLGIRVNGDLSVPCYVWSFLRVFMVLCALIAARRLIFGG
jgi:hypothetical protein